MKVSNPEDESPPDDQRSSLKISDLDIPEGICQDFIDEGITELNPPQRDAVGAGLMDGEDMVVASPTASGKTFIAELAMVNQVKKEDKKAVYIVPLKALASEKYQDFSGRYSDLDVRMSVGDYDDSGTGLETADIIVATSEKLDSMLRHNPSWIHEIGLVVVDEIHLLTSPERGPTLEVTISRLRDIIGTGSSTESSAFQMLGLSATISNSDELADWLDAELVESDYRPVELKHGIYHGNEVEFYPEGVEKEDVGAGVEGSDLEPEEDSPFSTGNEVKDEEKDEIESHTYFVDDRHGRGTLNLIEDTLELDNSTESEDSARSSERGTGSSKQCIIFCSSRKGAEKSSDRATGPTGEDLSREERKQLADYADRIESVLGSPTSQCERLAENVREGAAFHHAGLLPEQRSLVEEAFREGLIRTVSATPTLAAGVNLPAFRVIIRDLKRYTGRGMEYIPVLEYEQMCLPYDQKIVLPDGRREEIGEIVENERKKEVLSYDSGIEPKEISEFFTRKSEVIEIETETGAFKLTENHPVLVKEEGDEIWVEAGNIDAGDAIKLADGFKTANNPFYYQLLPEKCYIKGVGEVLKDYKQKFDVTDDEMAEELDISESSVYHYRNDRKAVPIHGVLKACDELGKSKEEIAEIIDNAKSSYGNSIEIPEKLTEDFLWLLGIIVTDGNLNRTEDPRHGSAYTSIRVFNKDEEIIEKAESVFSTLSLDCYKEEREGKYRLEVGNTLLAELMNTVFDIPYGNKSQKTRIPEIIFGLPENLQASYLEGVYDGDGSYYKNEEEYKQRINFSTSSEKFANDLRELLAGFGIKSRLYSEHVEKLEINDTEYKVDKESYFLKIRNKDSVAKVSELIDPVKSDITVEEYSDYNNSNEHRKKATGYTEVLKINSRGEQKVYNIEVKDNENYITSSRAVLHNCGRAGRPKYDDRGEAISIAKSGDQDEILERYIAGEPERIQSKLNAEPILRMHTLSLVASRFCTSMPDLKEFYKKTFYAHQFSSVGGLEEVEGTVEEVVEQLREYGFLKPGEIKATEVGKRVSELYIDPDSAHHILETLEKSGDRDTRPITFLFMLARTSEMTPRLRVKDDEYSDIAQELVDAEEYILEEVPEEWEPRYDHFLECMKTSMMMQGWMSELDEERLMEKYGIAPGGIRAKMQNADWLLYAAKELARMEGVQGDVEKELERVRLRLKHGIEEELLALVKYDQIGRVRARKLYDHGVRSREDIRETSFEKLKKLIGKRTAEKLKKQVGQENIFDRENVLDYFE